MVTSEEQLQRANETITPAATSVLRTSFLGIGGLLETR
jgi:hypothetical protein